MASALRAAAMIYLQMVIIPAITSSGENIITVIIA